MVLINKPKLAATIQYGNNKMKTIIIDNKIQLVEDSTRINVTVICPKSNIQKMLDETNARLISKSEIKLSYNHHAGITYKVVINVIFSRIEKYLKIVDVYGAENIKSYKELIEINRIGFGQSYALMHCCKNEITGIYAFGDCSYYIKESHSTYYYYKNGQKPIILNDNQRTNFGQKRYVQNNGKWASNRKF